MTILALAAATTAGCVPSYPVAKGEIDRYWLLTDLASGATPAAPKASEGFRMPVKVVIRAGDDEASASDSLALAMTKLREGTDELEISITGSHTAQFIGLLRDIRSIMERMEAMLDTAGRTSRNQWAAALATALVKAELVSRPFTAEPNSPATAWPGDVFGSAAGPMLQMLAVYLNQQAEGGLLDQLTPAEKRRLHDVLAEMMVRVGFEVAGKAATVQVRREVAAAMRGSGDPAALHAGLAKLLTERIVTAPPARGNSKQLLVKNILKWGPKAIGLAESFLGQWDRMEAITVELLRRRGRIAVAVTVAVKPGKPIRIADVVTGLPTVVFEGTSRLIIQPDAAGAGETIISFRSGKGGGAVELRYEGLIFAVVRLLAIPLADGPLRELRVSSSSPPEGKQLFNIALLFEAPDDKSDPRRMIVVQNAGLKRLVREAFEVRTVTESSESVFNYLTPQRRYTYMREKTLSSGPAVSGAK